MYIKPYWLYRDSPVSCFGFNSYLKIRVYDLAPVIFLISITPDTGLIQLNISLVFDTM